MLIEKIIYGKNSASVIAEGKEYPVDPDCVVLYRIKAGEETNDASFAEFIAESERVRCKKYLFSQIDRYSKTRKGYIGKLREKGFSFGAVKAAVSRAEELGLIDDMRFAENYYEKYKTKKGVNRIKNELKAKGIDRETLAFLDGQGDETEAAVSLAEKFMKRREKTPETRLKLLRHLAGKGFSFDTASKAAASVFSEEDF